MDNYRRMIIVAGVVVAGAVVTIGCGPSVAHADSPPPVTQAKPADETLFLMGFFPIGVFSQPVESFGKWKSLGINTLLEVPMNHDPAAWDRGAQAAGMRIIRRPLADPRSDIGRDDLLAWSQWDEPDAAGRIAQWTPMFEKTYAEWKSIDPNRKVFVNFAGPDISWFTTRNDAYSKEYASYYPRLIAAADWVANDLYPCGGWLNKAHEGRRGDVTLIAEPIEILKRMTDKPQFAFIEASEIERGNVPGAHCPSPDQVRAEIWIAIVHGVRGIFYFPAVVGTGGFKFDGMPEPVAKEVAAQNAVITQLAPILQGPINPSSMNVAVAAPLRAGWRKSGETSLIFVVNTEPRPLQKVEVKLTGISDGTALTIVGESREVKVQNGAVRDDFGPYSVRIYQSK